MHLPLYENCIWVTVCTTRHTHLHGLLQLKMAQPHLVKATSPLTWMIVAVFLFIFCLSPLISTLLIEFQSTPLTRQLGHIDLCPGTTENFHLTGQELYHQWLQSPVWTEYWAINQVSNIKRNYIPLLFPLSIHFLISSSTVACEENLSMSCWFTFLTYLSSHTPSHIMSLSIPGLVSHPHSLLYLRLPSVLALWADTSVESSPMTDTSSLISPLRTLVRALSTAHSICKWGKS